MGGDTGPPAKVIQPATGTGQGILSHFQDFHPVLYPILVTFAGFWPRTTPKSLDPGLTKFRNGFGTLKIGEDRVDTTRHALSCVGWGRLGFGWAGATDADPPLPTANHPNGHPTVPTDG